MKGLRARGGFTVDIAWDKGTITKAVVHSTIGGTLRLRSYQPLSGKDLRQATGDCPNSFMAPADISQPLSAKPDPQASIIKPQVPEVYEYDLDTTPGQVYIVKE